MSQVYQKADSSIFSDMSSSKNYISYPHTSYQCSQFKKPHSSQSNSPNNDSEFKSDDDSSNDNSFEEMDAVKRFCNLSKPIGSNGTEQKSVNIDNPVNTLPTVDKCVDENNENIIAHYENKADGNIKSSLKNDLDESNSCADLTENLPEKFQSDTDIDKNSSDLIQENSNGFAGNSHDQILSTKPEHLEIEKPLEGEINGSSGDRSVTIKENDKTLATVIEEDVFTDPIDDRSSSSSPEKPTSESLTKSDRPVRKRPPSLKLIEAAGGLTSAKNFCGKSKSFIFTKFTST
jgi:hypothetical protein